MWSRFIILTLGCFLNLVTLLAAEPADGCDTIQPIPTEKLIVGKDTIDAFIHDKAFGRYDRGLRNHLFMPKGGWIFGLTVSYGELDISDMKMLTLIKDLDFNSSAFSINPDVAYSLANNQTLGLRLSYANANVNLGGLDVVIMDDLEFTLSDVSYIQNSYGASIFYRHYIGLDRAHRFGLFNELDVAYRGSSSTFNRLYDGEPRITDSKASRFSAVYSPGLCVFIQEFVSFNVSFGIFEVYYNTEHQITDNIDEGSRSSSGASFRLNLFNLRFGISVHI